VKLRKIYQESGLSRQTLVPPEHVVDSVILGDVPKVTEDGRYRVPLVGLPGYPLPRQVTLGVFSAGQYAPDSRLDAIYDAAARGEGYSSSLPAREGIFELLSPVLADGRYDAWVIAVE